MNLCEPENKDFVLEQLSKFDSEVVGYLLIIANELEKAKKKHVGWPEDFIHQTAIVSEEAGELTKASLEHVYENGAYYLMHQEAIQTGAMALRFLTENWNRPKEIASRKTGN